MTAPFSKLIKKFRDESISAEEMRRLRETVDSATDEELSDVLDSDWRDFYNDSEVKELRRNRWRRCLWSGAAAIAVFVSAGLSVMFYRELHAADDAVTIFASTAMQTSAVVLPDGSRVTMTRDSELAFRQAGFARGRRNVAFWGEGYFEIQSDAAHPFVINTSGFEVVVKGTVFNLYSNNADSIAELALESGVVEIKMADSDNVTTVRPSQKVIINRNSGVVDLVPCPDVRCMSAWKRGEIVLNDATAADLAATFRRYYGVNIDIAGDDKMTFTGTLPTNSIQVAMKVVQIALDAEVTVRP